MSDVWGSRSDIYVFVLRNALVIKYSMQGRGIPGCCALRGTTKVTGPGRLTKNWAWTEDLIARLLHLKTGFGLRKVNMEDLRLRQSRIGVNFAGKCWAEKPYRFWFSKPKSGVILICPKLFPKVY